MVVYPKALPQKSKVGPKYKWFKTSYLQLFFWKYYFECTISFIFVRTFQWTSSKFFYSKFFSRKSQREQRLAKKKSLILQYSFAQKISLILRTSTHFTLKIICSRKNVKNLSHFTDFPANMFGVCLMLQKTFALHHSLMPKKCSLEALLKHISVYFCVSPEENVCFKEKVEKVRFYLVI